MTDDTGSAMDTSDVTLLEQHSPDGTIAAIVQQEGAVVYFYLVGAADTGYGLRSCWVRNLGRAPDQLDAAAMREGRAPMLPREYCVHPEGAAPFDPAALSVVWFEEGGGAALLEAGVTMAIIPPWSAHLAFSGYAADCNSESTLCWPLRDDNVLHEQVRAAALYWDAWDAEQTPWELIQEAQVEAYATQLGDYDKYYNINGDNWPPRALVRVPVHGGAALATVGVALRAQPLVEQSTGDATPFCRIELGVALARDYLGHADRLARYLSGQAAFPWTANTWFGPFHTMPCDALSGTGFTAMLLCREFPGAPPLALPAFRGDPVNMLWAIPITASELEFAMAASGAELAQKLAQAGVGWLTGARHSVV